MSVDVNIDYLLFGPPPAPYTLPEQSELWAAYVRDVMVATGCTACVFMFPGEQFLREDIIATIVKSARLQRRRAVVVPHVEDGPTGLCTTYRLRVLLDEVPTQLHRFIGPDRDESFVQGIVAYQGMLAENVYTMDVYASSVRAAECAPASDDVLSNDNTRARYKKDRDLGVQLEWPPALVRLACEMPSDANICKALEAYQRWMPTRAWATDDVKQLATTAFTYAEEAAVTADASWFTAFRCQSYAASLRIDTGLQFPRPFSDVSDFKRAVANSPFKEFAPSAFHADRMRRCKPWSAPAICVVPATLSYQHGCIEGYRSQSLRKGFWYAEDRVNALYAPYLTGVFSQCALDSTNAALCILVIDDELTQHELQNVLRTLLQLQVEGGIPICVGGPWLTEYMYSGYLITTPPHCEVTGQAVAARVHQLLSNLGQRLSMAAQVRAYGYCRGIWGSDKWRYYDVVLKAERLRPKRGLQLSDL